MILDKELNLSEPQLPHQYNRGLINSACFTEELWGSDESYVDI